MVKLEPKGAVLEMEDGVFRIARNAGEDDSALLMRAAEIVRLTPKQRRGLAQRQRMAQQRADEGRPREGDQHIVAAVSSTPDAVAKRERTRVAAALDASGIAARLFAVDDKKTDK